MSGRRYKSGPSREQGCLLPPHVEDYVSSTNPVRAIDVYVDSLDLAALGFVNAQGGIQQGQPSYSPSDMLKLYLYGYLNRVQSSRRLEHEAHRNLEVIWLLRGLRPSYKTIADFRKVNRKALKLVNRDFVLLCKELDLYGGELVGIDGAFFNGNAGVGSIYTASKLKKQQSKIEAAIARYLNALEAEDAREGAVTLVDDRRLHEKLERLRVRQKDCQDKQRQLKERGDTQLSLTDGDARLLRKQGQVTAGYNVQCAVDDKYKLLVVCDVVNDGNDLGQLYPMAQKAKEVLGVETLTVVADSGYYKQTHLKACKDDGITPYVAIPEPNKTERFSRKEFRYEADRDAYCCPAGEYLERQSRQTKGDTVNFKYAIKASICQACSLKGRCLPKKTPYRQIYRYEHEEVVVAHEERMHQKGRTYMKKRAALAEHPFGTLKVWCGWLHFLTRGLGKVRAEMDLLMLSYNFKRVLNILGVEAFRAYCLQRKARIGRNSGLFYLFLHRMWEIRGILGRFMMIFSTLVVWNVENEPIRNQPI